MAGGVLQSGSVDKNEDFSGVWIDMFREMRKYRLQMNLVSAFGWKRESKWRKHTT